MYLILRFTAILKNQGQNQTMQCSHLLSICIKVSPTYAVKFCKVGYIITMLSEHEIEKHAPHALETYL